MAHFKTLLFLSLLFTVVLVFSSKASADNVPGVAQTQGGAEVDHHHGDGWYRGGGGGWYRRGGGGWYRRGGGGWYRGGGGGGYYCRYRHCKYGAGGAETKSGEIESTNPKP